MVSPLHSSAVLILQQATRSTSQGDGRAASVDLVAVANGVEDTGRTDGATRQAKTKIAESFFKPNAPSVTEFKLHLMKRLGDELGIEFEDHETNASFGKAVKAAIDDIKRQPGGFAILSAIEKTLGFDKLGFSLDTFVDALIDPESSEGRRVDAALKDHLGITDDDADAAKDAQKALNAVVRFDTDGLYALVQN